MAITKVTEETINEAVKAGREAIGSYNTPELSKDIGELTYKALIQQEAFSLQESQHIIILINNMKNVILRLENRCDAIIAHNMAETFKVHNFKYDGEALNTVKFKTEAIQKYTPTELQEWLKDIKGKSKPEILLENS